MTHATSHFGLFWWTIIPLSIALACLMGAEQERAPGAPANGAGVGLVFDESGEWQVCGQVGNLTSVPFTMPKEAPGLASASAFETHIQKLAAGDGAVTSAAGHAVNLAGALRLGAGNRIVDYHATRTIHCEADGDYLFLVANIGAMAVYINGELADWHGGDRGNGKARDLVMLPLKKGENFIIVRVMVQGGLASFELRPCSSIEDALAEIAPRWDEFFSKVVIGENENLMLAFGGRVPFEKNACVRLLASGIDEDGGRWDEEKTGAPVKILFKTDQRLRHVCAARFPPGLYELEMELGGTVFRRLFCSGDAAIPFRRLRERLRVATRDREVLLQVELMEHRMAILSAPENSKNKDLNWQLKVVQTLGRLAQIEEAVKAGNPELRGIKGAQLRAFVSRVDAIPQSYRLYIPQCHSPDGAGVPLIVIVPTAVSEPRPFSDSPTIAMRLYAMAFDALAEEHGAAILWAGYHSLVMETPHEISYYNEAIADVLAHYNIDKKRMTLLGVCGGGVTVGMMAVDAPRRYAGVAFYRAIFHCSYPGISETRYLRCPDYNRWMKQTDPVSALLSPGGDAPRILLVQNTMKWEGHGDIELTHDFRRKARRAGVPVEYFFFDETKDQRMEVRYRETIEWCVRQSRADACDEPNGLIYQKHNATGPVSRAFGDSFVLVAGTGGTEAERKAVRAIADTFQETWRKWNFGRCVEAADREVTEDVMRGANLVLIGNARQNATWAKLAGAEPKGMPRLEAGRVAVDGREWDGENLLVCSVAMNPLAPDRRVVLIGMERPDSANPPKMNLQAEGWFDFAIWDCSKNEPALVTAEEYKNP